MKPIKKESKKAEERNNLEVVVVDYRRHKPAEHKREKSTEKHHTSHAKVNGITKTDTNSDVKIQEKRSETKHTERKSHPGSSSRKTFDVDGDDERICKTNVREHKFKHKHPNEDKDKTDKCDKKVSRDKKDYHKKQTSTSHKHESKTIRTSSSEKKLVKSVAICDETDVDTKDKKTHNEPNLKTKDGPSKSYLSPSSGHLLNVDKSLIVKPPNIFVYADSFVAKENVKTALVSILNRDK